MRDVDLDKNAFARMSVELDRDQPIFSGPVHVRFEEKKARALGSTGEEIIVVVRVLRGKCVVS